MHRSLNAFAGSCVFVLALAASPLPAEFLSFEIEFEDSGCIPCTQSLETRLKRIRGVQRVEVDLEAGTIRLQLAEDNRVRLGPLRARIGQDGTKIRSIEFTAIGAVTDGRLTPDGLTNALRLADPVDDVEQARVHGRLEDAAVEVEVLSLEPTR